MNWIVGMQRAIDYVEEHLAEEVDFFSKDFCTAFKRAFGITQLGYRKSYGNLVL